MREYDWTTGVPDNGNEWRKFRAIARLAPPGVPLFLHCLIRVETEGLVRLPGAGGDHFHCTVEPSPSHIRCRLLSYSEFFRVQGVLASVHRIAAFAFAMAIPRCQWRHRCVVTLGKFLLVLYSKPLWRKEDWKQRQKGDQSRPRKNPRASKRTSRRFSCGNS